MTKQDFFRAIIRLFGLYTLIGIISSISSILPMYFIGYSSIDSLVVIAIIIALLVTIGFFTLIIGYPDVIINVLRLMKGFDDNQIVCDKENIYKLIGIILFITGGYLIVDNTIPLVVTIYNQISSTKSFSLFPASNYGSIIKEIIFIVIGCYIVTNYVNVTQLLLKDNCRKAEQ